MGVGAILSNRRPRYRCLKAVDFGYFSVLVLDCVRGVFSSQKRTLFIVLNLAQNCCICSPLHCMSTFRDEAGKLKTSQ